jgi:hypothetical protein
MWRKGLFGGAAVLVAAGAIGAYLLFRPVSSVVRTVSSDVPTATAEQLEEVAGLRVFLAHQSVGRDLLAAVPGVFEEAGVSAPDIAESLEPDATANAGILHAFVGENGDPIGKIEAFDAAIRGGLGDAVDVAMIKFCYSDFHRGDDVSVVFDAYRRTMEALERDYPNVAFVYATASLTTEGSAFEQAKDRVKRMIGRPAYWPDPSRNVVRHEFNELVRAEYGDSVRLFDLAAVQATSEDGDLQLRRYKGADYFAMERSVATDPGHHTEVGSARLASALLATVADSVG